MGGQEATVVGPTPNRDSKAIVVWQHGEDADDDGPICLSESCLTPIPDEIEVTYRVSREDAAKRISVVRSHGLDPSWKDRAVAAADAALLAAWEEQS